MKTEYVSEVITENGKTFIHKDGKIYEKHPDGSLSLLQSVHSSADQDNDTQAELAAWELLREARKERDALQAQVDLMTTALRAIANTDYRGNRSSESTIAHKALTIAGITP